MSSGERRGCLAASVLAIGSLLASLAWWRRRPALRTSGVNTASLEAGHELRDATVRGLMPWVVALVVMVIVVIIVVSLFQFLLTGHLGRIFPTLGVDPNVQPPPAPRLETGNGQVLEELRIQEDQLLNNYTWIDQKNGTVRIPIDRAIELTAQRGLPTRPQNNAGSGVPLSQPSSASSGRVQEATSR